MDLCAGCCRKLHATTLFHRVRKWNGYYYQAAALWQTGVKLHLGHNGNICPSHHSASGGATNEAFGVSESSERDEDEPDLPGEDEWDSDDVNGTDPSGPLDSILPTPPSIDGFGNPFLTVVHHNGIHHIPVVSCRCVQAHDEDLLYINLGYFPASFTKIRTIFTFSVLRAFKMANLECKSTLYRYFQMLRRITCPAFPWKTPNRYREFRRVYRLFRHLTLLRRFGYAHLVKPPEKGDLAIFCAACPQPQVNLDADWKDDGMII